MFDVKACVDGGYTVLCKKSEGGYDTAFKFDTAGDTKIKTFGHAQGDSSCGNCSGTGSLSKGLQATIKGTY